jgi:pimeloyl-ACP methyl ester carboxylesterase
MKKRWLIPLLLLALVAGGYWFLSIPATTVPAGGESVARFAPGPFDIINEEFEATDDSRPLQAYNEFPGAASRTLKGALWRPAGLTQPAPLLVYNHGFLSFHREGLYLARFLASHGYTVLAVDYPLTGYRAPDGPFMRDVINQPGDISFLLDTLLARNADPADPLHGTIDPQRIAVAGTSLGGLTSTLATFHRNLRDPRIAAAISIAGPTSMLTREFFATRDVPFLVIFGDADVIVPYPANASPVRQKHPGTVLVTLKDASHAGFAQPASTLMRFMSNPDVVGCRAVLKGLQGELDGQRKTLMTVLGGTEDGIDASVQIDICTSSPIAVAMPAARQHMFTILAAYAFLESVFSSEAGVRDASRRYLLETLPRENASEVTVSL